MPERKSYVNVEFDCKDDPDADIETVTKRVQITQEGGLFVLDVERLKVPANVAFICVTTGELLRALGRVA